MSLLTADIFRLVIDYLFSQNCEKSAKCVLEEAEPLKEIRSNMGRRWWMYKVRGKNLAQLLHEYIELSEEIEVSYEELDSCNEQVESLIEKFHCFTNKTSSNEKVVEKKPNSASSELCHRFSMQYAEPMSENDSSDISRTLSTTKATTTSSTKQQFVSTLTRPVGLGRGRSKHYGSMKESMRKQSEETAVKQKLGKLITSLDDETLNSSIAKPIADFLASGNSKNVAPSSISSTLAKSSKLNAPMSLDEESALMESLLCALDSVDNDTSSKSSEILQQGRSKEGLAKSSPSDKPYHTTVSKISPSKMNDETVENIAAYLQNGSIVSGSSEKEITTDSEKSVKDGRSTTSAVSIMLSSVVDDDDTLTNLEFPSPKISNIKSEDQDKKEKGGKLKSDPPKSCSLRKDARDTKPVKIVTPKEVKPAKTSSKRSRPSKSPKNTTTNKPNPHPTTLAHSSTVHAKISKLETKNEKNDCENSKSKTKPEDKNRRSKRNMKSATKECKGEDEVNKGLPSSKSQNNNTGHEGSRLFDTEKKGATCESSVSRIPNSSIKGKRTSSKVLTPNDVKDQCSASEVKLSLYKEKDNLKAVSTNDHASSTVTNVDVAKPMSHKKETTSKKLGRPKLNKSTDVFKKSEKSASVSADYKDSKQNIISNIGKDKGEAGSGTTPIISAKRASVNRRRIITDDDDLPLKNGDPNSTKKRLGVKEKKKFPGDDDEDEVAASGSLRLTIERSLLTHVKSDLSRRGGESTPSDLISQISDKKMKPMSFLATLSHKFLEQAGVQVPAEERSESSKVEVTHYTTPTTNAVPPSAVGQIGAVGVQPSVTPSTAHHEAALWNEYVTFEERNAVTHNDSTVGYAAIPPGSQTSSSYVLPITVQPDGSFSIVEGSSNGHTHPTIQSTVTPIESVVNGDPNGLCYVDEQGTVIGNTNTNGQMENNNTTFEIFKDLLGDEMSAARHDFNSATKEGVTECMFNHAPQPPVAVKVASPSKCLPVTPCKNVRFVQTISPNHRVKQQDESIMLFAAENCETNHSTNVGGGRHVSYLPPTEQLAGGGAKSPAAITPRKGKDSPSLHPSQSYYSQKVTPQKTTSPCFKSFSTLFLSPNVERRFRLGSPLSQFQPVQRQCESSPIRRNLMFSARPTNSQDLNLSEDGDSLMTPPLPKNPNACSRCCHSSLSVVSSPPSGLLINTSGGGGCTSCHSTPTSNAATYFSPFPLSTREEKKVTVQPPCNTKTPLSTSVNSCCDQGGTTPKMVNTVRTVQKALFQKKGCESERSEASSTEDNEIANTPGLRYLSSEVENLSSGAEDSRSPFSHRKTGNCVIFKRSSVSQKDSKCRSIIKRYEVPELEKIVEESESPALPTATAPIPFNEVQLNLKRKRLLSPSKFTREESSPSKLIRVVSSHSPAIKKELVHARRVPLSQVSKRSPMHNTVFSSWEARYDVHNLDYHTARGSVVAGASTVGPSSAVDTTTSVSNYSNTDDRSYIKGVNVCRNLASEAEDLDPNMDLTTQVIQKTPKKKGDEDDKGRNCGKSLSPSGSRSSVVRQLGLSSPSQKNVHSADKDKLIHKSIKTKHAACVSRSTTTSSTTTSSLDNLDDGSVTQVTRTRTIRKSVRSSQAFKYEKWDKLESELRELKFIDSSNNVGLMCRTDLKIQEIRLIFQTPST